MEASKEATRLMGFDWFLSAHEESTIFNLISDNGHAGSAVEMSGNLSHCIACASLQSQAHPPLLPLWPHMGLELVHRISQTLDCACNALVFMSCAAPPAHDPC